MYFGEGLLSALLGAVYDRAIELQVSSLKIEASTGVGHCCCFYDMILVHNQSSLSISPGATETSKTIQKNI